MSHVTLIPMLYCTVTTGGISVAMKLIQNVCCYGGSIAADLRLTTRKRARVEHFALHCRYHHAKCPAIKCDELFMS